ncbi:MAG: hypothetical protein ACOH2M_21515 [Cypionkella sp.]
MSNPTKLQHLASEMRTHITHNGAAHQVLGRGLHLVLERNEGRCRLALGREAPVVPSEQEVAICAAAFSLPPEPRRSSRAARWRQPRTGRMVNFNIVELFWTEQEKEAA